MALRIVLADDSMTAQHMGQKILEDAGYEVVAVSNGASALKKLCEVLPDLAILDIYMPGYTGLEVCEKIKHLPETASIPVLLTVGKLEPYNPEDGAQVHAEGVIIKPFEASDLLAAVRAITGHSADAGGAVPPPPFVPPPAQSAEFSVSSGAPVDAVPEYPAVAPPPPPPPVTATPAYNIVTPPPYPVIDSSARVFQVTSLSEPEVPAPNSGMLPALSMEFFDSQSAAGSAAVPVSLVEPPAMPVPSAVPEPPVAPEPEAVPQSAPAVAEAPFFAARPPFDSIEIGAPEFFAAPLNSFPPESALETPVTAAPPAEPEVIPTAEPTSSAAAGVLEMASMPFDAHEAPQPFSFDLPEPPKLDDFSLPQPAESNAGDSSTDFSGLLEAELHPVAGVPPPEFLTPPEPAHMTALPLDPFDISSLTIEEVPVEESPVIHHPAPPLSPEPLAASFAASEELSPLGVLETYIPPVIALPPTPVAEPATESVAAVPPPATEAPVPHADVEFYSDLAGLVPVDRSTQAVSEAAAPPAPVIEHDSAVLPPWENILDSEFGSTLKEPPPAPAAVPAVTQETVPVSEPEVSLGGSAAVVPAVATEAAPAVATPSVPVVEIFEVFEPELYETPTPAPSAEFVPEIVAAPETVTAPEPPAVSAAVEAASPVVSVAQSVAFASVETSAEATPAVDAARIAGAVQRVFERFKPQIVAEIIRELGNGEE